MERPMSVLVAEESAAKILRKAGHQVTEAVDGLDVIDKTKENPPDVLVMDVILPRLGGLEVCRQLQAQAAAPPVLLVAAGADALARVEGLRAGADDFLPRPFAAEELLARVEVLGRRRRRGGPVRSADAEDDRDLLTGLPGQRLLARRLEEELGRAAAASETVSVMAIDLDNFEHVNSRFGRSAGDRLLQACARSIARACRDEDLLTRPGGDEFVVILPRLHFAGCIGAAEQVWREVRDTAILDAGNRIACGASVGVASYPSRDIDSSKDLLRFAHASLARAKAEGRGSICLYQHHGYLFQPTS
jgi:two-component system, cell cycle response regulator